MYFIVSLLLTIALLCALPAYLIGRKTIRESLLAAEEGFSSRTCTVFYTITGILFGLLLLFFAYNTAALIYGCMDDQSVVQGLHTVCSICSTVLFAWLHIHSRRARQRRSHKYAVSHRLSSLFSGVINSVGVICIFMGLVNPPLALLGILVFVIRYMVSYTAHKN